MYNSLHILLFSYFMIYKEKYNRIGGVMVSMLALNVVDRGFIGGVMVSMLASNVVDHGFIGGVMVSMLASNVVDGGFISGVMVSMLASSPDWVKPKTLKFVFVASPLSTQH
jgi:uncharacterized membrane protein